MPKLTVTAIVGNVSIQDPFPTDGLLSIEVPGGTSKDIEVTWGQLQRLSPSLTSAEISGDITYVVEASAGDARASEADLAGLPNVHGLDLATTALAVGAVTGAKVLGAALLAGQVKAAAVIGNALDANGHIELEAIIPGSDSNEYSVAIDPSLSGTGPTVAVAAGKITVSVDPATATYATTAAAINGDAVAKTMVKATAAGTGATLTATAYDVPLLGGQGAGIAITVGGISATIVEALDTAVTYDVDITALTATDLAIVDFRSGAKLTRLGVILS